MIIPVLIFDFLLPLLLLTATVCTELLLSLFSDSSIMLTLVFDLFNYIFLNAELNYNPPIVFPLVVPLLEA